MIQKAENLNTPLQPSLDIAGVISRFFSSLLESVKVTTMIFAFIFLFFFGWIIAPIVGILKWIWNVWGKYYNWLGDWAVSNGL